MEFLILHCEGGWKRKQVQKGSVKAVLNRSEGISGCLRAGPKLKGSGGPLCHQCQILLPGDISDGLNLEQSVLPFSLWTGKWKTWAWKILAQDPESGLEPRPLAPAHCHFHCTRPLVFAWHLLPLVSNLLGNSHSLWTQPQGLLLSTS